MILYHTIKPLQDLVNIYAGSKIIGASEHRGKHEGFCPYAPCGALPQHGYILGLRAYGIRLSQTIRKARTGEASMLRKGMGATIRVAVLRSSGTS